MSQERWRSLHKKDITKLPFSQGSDLSSRLISSLTQIVSANLPAYIPEDVKTRIGSLPPPTVSFGAFVDGRFFESPVLFEETTDELLNAEDNTAKQTGIGLLNEIAIDTLAQETLGNIATKHAWLKPIAAYLKADNPIRPAYISGLKRSERQLGGKQNFETFRQNLVVSALSGNSEPTNTFLNGLGYDSLDSFAMQLGASKGYAPLESSLVKMVDKSEKIKSSLSGGFVHNSFPGVIFIPQAATLLYAVNLGLAIKYMQDLPHTLRNPVSAALNISIVGLTGYLGLKTGLIIPHLFTHELLHYFSTDIDHWGLKKVNYLPTL